MVIQKYIFEIQISDTFSIIFRDKKSSKKIFPVPKLSPKKLGQKTKNFDPTQFRSTHRDENSRSRSDRNLILIEKYEKGKKFHFYEQNLFMLFMFFLIKFFLLWQKQKDEIFYFYLLEIY
jgi:hypothetical protein